MFRGRIKNIHFVGIGGSGMSGIAEVLLNMGYNVSGSDLKESHVTKRLSALGIAIYIGHKEENVKGSHCVVYSSAVKPDNEELKEARKSDIPIIARAEMLSELMRMKYGVAIAGTHGKTTTTSMVASILARAKMDPTIVIGGKLNSIGANAKLGSGEFLIAEADESDGSFIKLTPTIAVITNIDREHMDHYKNMDEVKEAYLNFINKVPFYGLSVVCLDHPVIQELLPAIKRRHITYGFSPQAEVHALMVEQREGGSSFDTVVGGTAFGRFKIHVPGRHNVSNALAAIAVSRELEISEEHIRAGLDEFKGVERRFQIKGIANDIMVIDDYGHHPVEVKAVLRAIRDNWRRRVIAIFQPHRFSRTADLYKEFITAFNDADILILTDIYGAGEENIWGVSSEELYKEISKHGHKGVSYTAGLGEIPAYVRSIVKPGDIVITLGAGDVWKAGEMLLESLKEKRNKTNLKSL